MAWTKAKTAVVVGVSVLLAAGTATVVVEKMVSSPTDAYLQDTNLNDFEKAPPMVVIQRTHFQRFLMGTGGKRYSDKAVGRNIPLIHALADAYGFHPTRIISPQDMPTTKVDFLVTATDHPWERFQAEIKNQFGFVGRVETIETNVLLLQLGDAGASKLKVSPWPKSITPVTHDPFRFTEMSTQPLSTVASLVEGQMNIPVIDQTGLTNFYDMLLEWRPQTQMKDLASSRAALKRALQEQLGLELIATNMPIEMLVVEKVK